MAARDSFLWALREFARIDIATATFYALAVIAFAAVRDTVTLAVLAPLAVVAGIVGLAIFRRRKS